MSPNSDGYHTLQLVVDLATSELSCHVIWITAASRLSDHHCLWLFIQPQNGRLEDTMRLLTRARQASSHPLKTALLPHNVGSHERIGFWYLLLGIALLLLLASASRA
jgi:hypothetical protein